MVQVVLDVVYMFMLSGPVDLLVLLDFIASCTWVVDMEKIGSIVIL